MTGFKNSGVFGHLLMALCCAGTLVGCGHKTPEGQVVAVVDGEEVTRRELAAEPQTDGADAGGSGPAVSATLSGVIDRKLAVAEAKRLKLDRTPEFVAQANRLQEVVLSRTLFERWASRVPPPSAAAITRYVDANPQRFSGRKLLLVDRIETAASSLDEKAIAPLHSIDAIAQYLQAHSQRFRREQVILDTSTLTPALYGKIMADTTGDPVALVQNGSATMFAVVEARDAPVPADRMRDMAVNALKQEAIAAKLADLRKSADIAYLPGYRPANARQGPAAE